MIVRVIIRATLITVDDQIIKIIKDNKNDDNTVDQWWKEEQM